MTFTQTATHNFEVAKWDGTNRSGLTMIGDQVLIFPDRAADKASKTGTIIVPETVKHQGDQAVESGVLVAMGEGAFYWAHDRVREFIGAKPKVGDRVVFGRYNGGEKHGKDGELYRVMTDKCIVAIQEL